ncbi:hypothetical protein Tco_1521717, partial [Tanacetum coccineum]
PVPYPDEQTDIDAYTAAFQLGFDFCFLCVREGEEQVRRLATIREMRYRSASMGYGEKMQSGDDMPLLRTMTDIEQVADTMLLLMDRWRKIVSVIKMKSGYDVKVLVDA